MFTYVYIRLLTKENKHPTDNSSQSVQEADYLHLPVMAQFYLAIGINNLKVIFTCVLNILAVKTE